MKRLHASVTKKCKMTMSILLMTLLMCILLQIQQLMISEIVPRENITKGLDEVPKEIITKGFETVPGQNMTKVLEKVWKKNTTIESVKRINKDHCITSKDLQDTTTDTVTVVTAYWNLGSFQKGDSKKLIFTPATYKNWITTFQYMTNPLVAFVDDERIAGLLRNLRMDFANITKIILINKSALWSFGLKDRINDIYSKSDYPKFFPNTVIPEYSCAQHAKYDSLEMAIKSNYFHTKHFTWLDIGYFRNNINCRRHFKLVLPAQFDPNRVAFTQMYDFKNISMRNIVYNNKVWVGGGMIFGKSKVILKFIAQYKKAIDIFLQMSLMSTDQQVIYGMFSQQGRKQIKPTIALQTYGSNNWFHLGFLCHRYVDNDHSFVKNSATSIRPSNQRK